MQHVEEPQLYCWKNEKPHITVRLLVGVDGVEPPTLPTVSRDALNQHFIFFVTKKSKASHYCEAFSGS